MLARIHRLHGAARRALSGNTADLGHFEHMLHLFGTLCGPDDGPVLGPDDDFRPYHGVVDLHCLADLIEVSVMGVSLYAIYSIQPTRACAGDLITLAGYGFDNVPQLVRFALWGSPNTWIEAEPETWSNEQITVIVPDGAGCGLRLAKPPRAHRACGRFIDAWPTDTGSAVFEGGAAQILNFAVNSKTDTLTVVPGETLEITWSTCAADDVDIVIVEDGTIIHTLSNAPAEGTWEQELEPCDATTELTVRITVSGTCDPPITQREITVFVHHLPTLSVHGIEVTQAIQYYRSDEHLTDPADQGDDNSVQLIAGKTGYVRVYLRSGLTDVDFDDGTLHGIDGRLTVDRIIGGQAEFVDQYLPNNGPVRRPLGI